MREDFKKVKGAKVVVQDFRQHGDDFCEAEAKGRPQSLSPTADGSHARGF
jgi:hypothetical protein